MTTKEEYSQLCNEQEIPLFLQDWWLSATCAGQQWDILFSRDAHGNVRAAMPYIIGKKWWSHFIQMPNLCPYGGGWIRPDLRDSFAETEAIAADFHKQMMDLKVSYCHLRFVQDSRLPDAFVAQGYKKIERCTYQIDDTSDLNKILDGFSRNKRKKLEKRTLTYQLGEIDPETFYRFHTACNAEKKQQLWYSREMLLVLWEKAQQRQQAKFVCIQDANGEPLAAAFVVWDKHKLYQLLNCYVHEDKDNGARELLTFEVIKLARQLGLAIDFVSHRNYLRHYGAQRKDFYAIKRSKSAIISLHFFSNWIRSFSHKKL